MRKQFFLLILPLLILPNLVNASWAFGYWDDDFYIELYSDSHWHYEYYPYSYYYDGWYYYDYPYRVYSSGTYYYYEPGWYSYDSYWAVAPDIYYDYYPANYYYYGGYWYSYPKWTYVYGPTYYGGWYYPCYYCSSGVGAPYSYPQLASCSEASLYANDISIVAGDVKEATVWINNNSKMNFEVKSVSVYIDSFDVSKRDLRYDSTVRAGRSGEITFDLVADEDAEDDTVYVTVKVSGQFTDSTYCSSSDIGEETFRVYLSEVPQSEAPQQSDPGAVSSSSFQSSQQQGWYEVQPEEPETELEEPEEPVEEPVVELQGNCNALGINTESITVDAGESEYGDFYILNYSGLDFYINSVTVEEYSPNFSASGVVKDSVVYSDSRARVGVRIDAFPTEEDEAGTAYITVKGYFSSGMECTLDQKAFTVYINSTDDPIDFSGFRLNVPNVVRINDYGYIEISVDNPIEREATIRIEGEDLEVSPTTIHILEMTLIERELYVSNLGGERGYIVYNIEMEGANFLQKYTRVEREVTEGEAVEEEGSRFELVSYESRVEIEDSANVDVVLRNDSSETIEVRLGIIGLPQQFYVRSIVDELRGNEEKSYSIEVMGNDLQPGTYTGYLDISFDGERITRKIELYVEGEEGAAIGGEEAAEEEDGISAAPGNFVSTAMLFLGNNAINFGLVLIALILIYLLYKGLTSSRQPREYRNNKWIKHKPTVE